MLRAEQSWGLTAVLHLAQSQRSHPRLELSSMKLEIPQAQAEGEKNNRGCFHPVFLLRSSPLGCDLNSLHTSYIHSKYFWNFKRTFLWSPMFSIAKMEFFLLEHFHTCSIFSSSLYLPFIKTISKLHDQGQGSLFSSEQNYSQIQARKSQGAYRWIWIPELSWCSHVPVYLSGSCIPTFSSWLKRMTF